jgi:predicted enzyme related to lactoylglutathione lyase
MNMYGGALDSVPLTLAQLTLSAEHVIAMVDFYNGLFAADLQPVAAYGTTLYRGQLHGLPFLICPNTLANVSAAQNRHQFTYTVSDLTTVMQRAQEVGGQMMQRDASTLTILDPDGNSIVFQQVADSEV